MNETNTTLGSVKARDILRDSRIFCMDNYGELMKISLPMFATLICYYFLIYTIMWFSIKNADVSKTLVLAILNIPLSIIGGFIISMVMVSYIKRLNAKVRGEELTLKDSFKGAAITALKIYGASMLGVMIIYIPLIVLGPVGAISAVIIGAYGQAAEVGTFLILLIILALLIFFTVFIIWACYVGVHLMILIQTMIIDPLVTKWIKWCRILVKGRIKNISGVLLGIYGIILLASLLVVVPLNIIFPGELLYIIISSSIMLIITLLIYPYMMTSMILLYYRLKSANWDVISKFLAEEKEKDAHRVKMAMQSTEKAIEPGNK